MASLVLGRGCGESASTDHHQLAVLIGSYSALPGEPKVAEVLMVGKFSHPRFLGKTALVCPRQNGRRRLEACGLNTRSTVAIFRRFERVGCARIWNRNLLGRVRSHHGRWQCLKLTCTKLKRSSSP